MNLPQNQIKKRIKRKDDTKYKMKMHTMWLYLRHREAVNEMFEIINSIKARKKISRCSQYKKIG